MIYPQLLWSFFQIGLFSIGGGYAALPLIQHQVVELRGWLTMTQFADIVTIAEMTPGPIAINAATFVGTRMAGLPGAVAATLGCVLPSCVISLFLAFLYYRYKGLALVQGILSGLRPAVVAMIASAGWSLVLLTFFGEQGPSVGLDGVRFVSAFLFLAAFLILRRWKPSPVLVMAGAGLAGLLLSLF